MKFAEDEIHIQQGNPTLISKYCSNDSDLMNKMAARAKNEQYLLNYKVDFGKTILERFLQGPFQKLFCSKILV